MYDYLIMKFPLLSIASQKHYKDALEVFNTLRKVDKLSGGEEIYLAALSDLLDMYVARNNLGEPAPA